MTAMVIIGSGRAASSDPKEFSRNAPSFYADSAGWLITAAGEAALSTCEDEVLSTPDEVGMLVLSRQGTELTLRNLANGTSVGAVSPLRFAGANPGVLAGLSCITWGLRGPSLNFSMDPEAGLGTAAVVAASWLRRGQARHVLLAVHELHGQEQVAHCVVVRAAAAGEADERAELRHLLLGREEHRDAVAV